MTKCKFTEQQLWDFVNRTDTHERVEIAIDFLTHLDGLSIELYDELMNTLAYISRELYHMDRETDRDMYSPSCPWNAPGMSARDFI